jgi:multisubunit Na+/H+ antiporter MnhE subunit
VRLIVLTKTHAKSSVSPKFIEVSCAKLLTFAAMYLMYMLLVSPPDKAEMTIAFVVAAVAMAAAVIFRAGESVRFCPSFRDILQGWRIPAIAVEGVCRLFGSLFLQLLGISNAGDSMRAMPFSAWKSDCRSSARAALAELYTTMTPNSIVLGISHKQKLLLLHQVVPSKPSQMILNLGGHC